MKKAAKISIIVSVIAITLIVVSLIFVPKLVHNHELNEIQQSALEELSRFEGQYDPQSIVLSNTNLGRARYLAEQIGATLRINERGNFATLTLPEGTTVEDVYRDDANREFIDSFSLDMYVRICDVDEEEDSVDSHLPISPKYDVTDPLYQHQSYLNYLHMENTWEMYKGDGITVAIIDTGIDTDHPEFAGKISDYSYNATEDKIVKDYDDWSLIEDEQGHGTSVAGVIAAAMDGEGITGIAPNVTLIIIKAECSPDGSFLRGSDLLYGLYYAIERDVDVVNMSFGSSGNIYEEALRLAVDSDVICVAAAGNQSTSGLTFPAADPNCIGVGALEDGGWNLAFYSNFGDNSDIVAPGTVYTTAIGGGYRVINGTSFSSPITAAAIALLRQQNWNMEFPDVVELLYASSYDLGGLGEDYYYGFGALDMSALLLEERGKIIFDMLTDEVKDLEYVFIRNHTLQNIPEPERLYAVFDGWYYDVHTTDELNWYRDVFTSDLTLYANWGNEDDVIPYIYVILDDGTVEIRSYTGHRRYITIPERIENRIVSSIGDFAFTGQERLRQINLPTFLINIGLNAFSNCSNLVQMHIPDLIRVIGDSAFANDSRLYQVTFGQNCQLEIIENKAFSNCNLLSFEIPQNLKEVTGAAFVGCTSLMNYTVRKGNNYFQTIDGVLYNKTLSTLVAYPAGKVGFHYNLPDNTTTIGSCAFAFSKISSIDLNSVEFIGSSAFTGTMITNLLLPDTVVSVGKGAFSSCGNLAEVKLSNNMSIIEAGTFKFCGSLKSIFVPKRIQILDFDMPYGGAFENCGSLEEVVFEEESQLVLINSNVFNFDNIRTIDIPKGVLSIGGLAFGHNYNLSSIHFAEDSELKEIGGSSSIEVPGFGAFESCISLSSIILPQSLETISFFAFQNSGIQEIVIPENVSTISPAAFASCHNLTNIYVDQKNEKYYDLDGVLYSKTHTTLLEYPAGRMDNTYVIPNAVTEIGDGAFYDSWNLFTVDFPGELETIGEFSFYGCISASHYNLPDSLVYIKRWAFAENTSLGYIYIPDNVMQISNYAFAYDWNCESIIFNDSSKLPRISFRAFAYSGIHSLRIPPHVSTIAQYAFEGCKKLESVTFAADSKLESISAYLFDGAENIRSITFEPGSSLLYILAHGFEGLEKLETVDFGDARLQNIDNFAFRYCESLNNLMIPDSVENIGRYAFFGDENLSTLYIPAAVKSIGRYAFHTLSESLNVFFLGDMLPLKLQENWDHGIAGYYVNVDEIITIDDWEIARLKSGNTALIRYLGNEEAIDLTRIDFGGDITQIGGYAFANSAISTINLPQSLESIQRHAFENSKLSSISIPSNVSFIGQYAFYGTDLSSVTISNDSDLYIIEQYAFAHTRYLKSFAIPSSIETIQSYAFYESSLKSISFPDDGLIKRIYPFTFAGTDLETLVLPDTIIYIDDNAFRDCLQLKKVVFGKADNIQIHSNAFYNTGISELYLPENIEYIGEYAFTGLNNLEEYAVSENNPYYKAVDGVLFSKDGRELIAFPANRVGYYLVPNEVEVIGFGAFENSRIDTIDFEDNINLLTIGYRAFYNACFLKAITIPPSVVSIDYYAFAMCSSLSSVSFAENNHLTGIYEGAFYACSSLKNIVVPKTIIEISDYAFYGCRSLKNFPIVDESEIKGIYDYAFAYSGISGDLTIPDTIIDIGRYAFKGTDISTLFISTSKNRVLFIELGAFEDCNNLTTVTLPFIGRSFEDKSHFWIGYIFGAGKPEANNTYIPKDISTIIIQDGIKCIYNDTFLGVTCVNEIIFPQTLEVIYQEPFRDCTSYHSFNKKLFLCDLHSSSMDCILGINTIGTVDYEIVASAFPEGADIDYIFTPIDDNMYRIGHIDGFDYWYNISENTYSLVSYRGKCQEVSLPLSIEGHSYSVRLSQSSASTIIIPSTVIGDHFNLPQSVTKVILEEGFTNLSEQAFTYNSSLKEVYLPDGLLELGWGSFYGCEGLVSIRLPESLKTIGSHAFFKCSSLKDIIIPSCVEIIGEFAFAECISLPEIDIPRSIKNIGDYAFVGSSISGDFDFQRVERIGECAFQNCKNISSVQIGPNTKFEIGAFSGCSCYLQIDENNTFYTVQGDFIFDEGSLVYVNSSAEGIVQMPSMIGNNVIDTIPNYAFYGLKNVTEILLPDSISSIGFLAFSNCTSLQKIVIPNSVKTIGSSVFLNCTSLTDVTLSNQIETIESYTFNGCTSLQEILIPDKVTMICEGAFSNCTSLEEIVIPESVERIGYEAFNNCYSLNSIQIEGQIETIPSNCFYNCISLYSIVLPNSVSLLENGCFTNCHSLENVTLPNNLVSIGGDCFANCYNLKLIELPNQLVELGGGCFSYCTSLETIRIPESVSELPNYCFDYCWSLKNVVLPNQLSNLGEYCFRYCYDLKTIELPEQLLSIGNGCFEFSGLTRIIIPNNVQDIPEVCFYYCEQLDSVTIGKNVNHIFWTAFWSCPSLRTVYNNSNLTILPGSEDNGCVAARADVVLPDGTILKFDSPDANTTAIEYYVEDEFLFQYDGIDYTLIRYLGDQQDITLPTSCCGQEYKIYLFSTQIETIRFPKGMKSFLSDHVGSSAEGAFSKCLVLKNVFFNDIETVLSASFSDCHELEYVDMPNVKVIDSGAFFQCYSLKQIVFPNCIQKIGWFAFNGCHALSSIVLNKNCTLMSDCFTDTAFYNDKNNWENGCLLLGNNIIEYDENASIFEYNEGYSLATGALDKCHKVETAVLHTVLNLSDGALLGSLSNLKTLIIDCAFDDDISCLIGDGHPKETINSIVLTHNFIKNQLKKVAFLVQNGTIFVDEYEENLMWDHDRPGWCGNCKVYYKGQWAFAKYVDPITGQIYEQYHSIYEILKPPFIDDIINGPTVTAFMGWDIDGDGVVDQLPATSAKDINATAVMVEFDNICSISFYDFFGQLISKKDYLYGEAIELPLNPTKKGYTFNGWIGYRDNMVATQNVDFYGNWEHEGEGHNYIVETINPTCIDRGYQRHTCSICDDVYDDNYIEPNGHHFDDWIIETNASCTEEGVRYHVCTSCTEKEYDVIQAHGHSYVLIENHNSTCTHTGEKTFRCSYCGDEISEITPITQHQYVKRIVSKTWLRWLIEKLLNMFFGYVGNDAFYYQCSVCGHVMTYDESVSVQSVSQEICDHQTGDWIIDIEPSCVDGIMTKRCQICQKVIEAKVINATGQHSYLEWSTSVEPSCTTKGEQIRHCANCDHFESRQVDPVGHDYSAEWTIDVAATCTNVGSKSHHCSRCDSKNDVTEIPMLEHTVSDWIVDKASSCTELGSSHKECSVCHTILKSEEIPMLDHSYGEWIRTKNPTCTELGQEKRVCENCAHVDTRDLNSLGHDYSAEWTIDVAATCTSVGSKSHHCSRCDSKIDVTEIPMLEHMVSDWVVDKPASCSELGSRHKECTVCHTILESEGIPMLDHTYGEWIRTKNPTCTESGQENRICTNCAHVDTRVIDALGHDYSSEWTIDVVATCTSVGSKSHHCSRCDSKIDLTEIPMLEHTSSEWITDHAPTCTDKGSKHIECLVCHEVLETQEIDIIAHTPSDWIIDKEATDLEPGSMHKECTMCHEVLETEEIAQIEHVYGEWSIEKTPTCTENGEERRRCVNCNYYQTRTIEALGHDYSTEWSIDISPTCTSVGSKSHHCSRCDSKIDVTEIPILEHTVSDWFIDKPASCTEIGSKHKECTVCHALLDSEEIPMLEHAFGNWIVVKAATCNETGLERRVCANCAYVESREISALGHDYSAEWSIDVSPTCTSVGSKSHHCSRCDSKIDATEIPILEHTISDWIIDKPASCTEIGYKHKECTACHAIIDSEEIPMLEHTYGQWIEVKAATCTEAGLERHVCANCAHVESRDITALGHDYSTEWTFDIEATCTYAGSKSHHCSRCDSKIDVTEIPMIEHTISEWIVDVEATATSVGSRHKECTVCHTVLETEEIPMHQHVFGEWSIVKAATCTEKGEERRICSDCAFVESRLINALGHDYSSAWTIDAEPTCTSVGSKSHHCTRCDSRSDETEIPMIEHSTSEWIIDKAATCTSTGSKHKECTVCHTVLVTEDLPMIQHTFGQWMADPDGQHHSRSCDCGKKETEDHHWNNGEVTAQPTHTSEGVRTFTCSDCGATRTEVIEKNQDHEFGPWTDTTDGIHHKRACACGEEETEEHLWGEPDASGMISCTACGAQKESESDDQETTPVEVIINEDAFGKPHFEGDMTEIADKFLTEEEQSRIEAGEKLNILLEVQDVKDTITEEEKELIENEVGEYQVVLYLDISVMKQIGSDDPTVITQTNGKVKLSIEVPQELKLEGMDVKIVRLHEGVATVINAEYDSSNHTVSFETDQFSTYALVVSEKETSESILKKGCGSVLTTGTIGIAFVCLFALFALKKKEQID